MTERPAPSFRDWLGTDLERARRAYRQDNHSTDTPAAATAGVSQHQEPTSHA